MSIDLRISSGRFNNNSLMDLTGGDVGDLDVVGWADCLNVGWLDVGWWDHILRCIAISWVVVLSNVSRRTRISSRLVRGLSMLS